jgi:F0F1-type ATP synthase membrane subunit b/b'
MSINDGCFDLDMLHRLRQYLKELADAEREASRLVREHRSKASKVIASDIENARKRGDALTVRRLKRVENVVAAIEESPAALLHH